MSRPALLLVFVLAGLGAAGADADATQDAEPVLRRLVHRFDFEDAETRPIEMPRNVRRVPGGPIFGRIALTNDVSTSGRWSLGFELDGVSLVAEVVSGVVPVMPGSQYQVSVKVRTSRLEHARARLSAWLHDGATGAAIEGSRVHSEAVRSENAWTTLAVEVPAADAASANLVIELEVLQPRDRATRVDDATPQYADIGGRAYFDELSVWLVPRLELGSDAPGNVFVGRPPRLTMTVTDVLQPMPDALLRIRDATGRLVATRRLETGGRHAVHQLDFDALPYGWYQAVAELTHVGRGGVAATSRTRLDFAHVPFAAAVTLASPRFGVVVDAPVSGQDVTLELAATLGVCSAIATVRDRGGPDAAGGDDAAGGHDAAGSASGEAARVAEGVRGLARHVNELLLAVDPNGGEPLVAVARRLAIQVRPWVAGWQLGSVASIALDPTPIELADDATAGALGLASEGGVTLLPWPAEQPVSDRDCNIVVPYHVRPGDIPALLEAWPSPRTVTLLRPPADLYPPDQRLGDLVARTLETWRAGVDRLFVETPWSSGSSRSPDASLPVVQRLARHLQGRRFGGRLTLADGVEAWLAEPAAGNEVALVAWSTIGPQIVDLALGAGTVEVFDRFGNATPAPLLEGRHRLRLSHEPVFVEGVDRRLARFRVAFAIEPAFVPTEQRRHERTVRLTNPWDVPVSGHVLLGNDPQWRIEPQAIAFSIAPGATASLPVSFVPSRSMIAGPRTLEAVVELTADRPYRFRARAHLETGLEDLQLHESWRLVRSSTGEGTDLIVRLEVRNVGDRPVTLSAFVQGRGVGLQRQPIGRLDPGAMAARTFTIAGVTGGVDGGRVYVGVDEPGQVRRLTHEIDTSAPER